MKPKMIEIVQTSQDALPTVAAIPPIENSTSAGTPLATQNAPVQSIFRCRPNSVPSALTVPVVAAAVLMATPRLSRIFQESRMTTLSRSHSHAACPDESSTDAHRAAPHLAQKWFRQRAQNGSPLLALKA